MNNRKKERIQPERCTAPKTDVAMIIKVTAKCCGCGKRENFYVDERQNDILECHCKNCGSDKYLITFR